MICSGGMVPLSFTTGVGADGKGAGEELVIPAGKTNDILIHMPSNSTLQWRFGLQDKDIGFHISGWIANNEPSQRTNIKPGQLIPITQSIDGIHIFTETYIQSTDTNKNPFKVPANSIIGTTIDPLTAPNDILSLIKSTNSSSSPKANTIEIVSNTRINGTSSPIIGTWTTPKDSSVIIRIRFDNNYSWMSSKTIARRIDITVPNTECIRAEDKDDLLAQARSLHREGIAEWTTKRNQNKNN